MGRKSLTNEMIDQNIKNKPVQRIGNYVNGLSKIDWKCLNCNNIWPTTYASIIRSKQGCPECTNRKLSNEIINNRLANYNIIITSNYVDNNTNSQFKCLNCFNIWNDVPRNALSVHKCHFCDRKGGHSSRLNNEIIDFLLKDRNIVRKSNYISNSLLKLFCNICSHSWEAEQTFIAHNTGCPKCYGNAPLNNEEIDKRLVGRGIKRLGNYINAKTNLEVQCEICNHIWAPKAGGLVAGKEYGCPVCNVSSCSEKMIISIFDKYNINYKYNYCINKIDLLEVKKYRVDFYFKKFGLIIEYNGAQHYNATTCFGSATKETAEERLLEQKARDQYIADFCQTHNIELIWIDGRKYYTHKLNKYIEDYILPIIKNHKKI